MSKSIQLYRNGKLINIFAKVSGTDYKSLNEYRWRLHSGGYAVRTATKGERLEGYPPQIYMHRQVMQHPCKMHIDHKNGNKLDNTRKNLREATPAQNISSRRSSRKSNTGFIGVHQIAIKKFVAYITAKNERISLGTYPDPIVAAIQRDAAARYYHGTFATLNFEFGG